MNKILKIISSVLVTLGFVSFLAVGYYAKQENPIVVAQEFDELICQGPIIPNGAIAEDVIELLNVVFKEYKKVAMDVQSALGHAQAIWGNLSQPGGVCNFSKCQPEMANDKPGVVANVAPRFFFRATAFKLAAEVAIRPPSCIPREAVGDPCSLGDIKESIRQLDNLKTSFSLGYQAIHDLFLTASESVTEDTRIKLNDYLGRPEENANTDDGPVNKITKQEEIRRKMEAVEALVSLCSPSDLERKLIAEGKMGEKKIVKCIDALRSGAYEMPRPWSEMCEVECSAGATELCISCLGECKGTSILAKLNCRIYGTETTAKVPENCSNGADDSCCGDVCGGGYFEYMSVPCNECLARDLPEGEYERFLCGGNHKNWICCNAKIL